MYVDPRLTRGDHDSDEKFSCIYTMLRSFGSNVFGLGGLVGGPGLGAATLVATAGSITSRLRLDIDILSASAVNADTGRDTGGTPGRGLSRSVEDVDEELGLEVSAGGRGHVGVIGVRSMLDPSLSIMWPSCVNESSPIEVRCEMKESRFDSLRP